MFDIFGIFGFLSCEKVGTNIFLCNRLFNEYKSNRMFSLFFKMAKDSKGEEVCESLKAYVCQLNPESKRNLRKNYDKAMSPFYGEWKTMNEVTFVTLRNRENVIDNLSLAVFKEIVGLGSQWYCVVRSFNRDFESFLMLALHYLPKDKFCMYREDETLLGPFLHAPWDDIGKSLCSQSTVSIEGYLAYLKLRVKKATQH